MAEIKRGTTPTFEVTFKELDFANVKTIDFIFKHQKSEAAKAILEKSYPDNAEYSDGIVQIRFTESETRLFTAGADVYMDTRITLTDDSIPETYIVKFTVTPTLFRERETS